MYLYIIDVKSYNKSTIKSWSLNMRTDVKIYAFVNDDAKILSVLKTQNYEYTLVHDYEELKSSVDNISYLFSHILIVDLEYVFSKNNILAKEIKKDLMRTWLAVVGYSENKVSLALKSKVYRLDFKAVFEQSNSANHANIVKHIVDYTNLHMETLQNNFITAFLHYNDLDKPLRDAKYLIDYLVYYYSLSKQDAADILLVVSSLIVAFHTETIGKVSEMIYTLFKSFEVNNLYKSYKLPKTFSEQLVGSILQCSCEFENAQKYLSTIDMMHVDMELKQNVQKFYESKNIVYTSYVEVDLFWEQIHFKLFSKYKNDDFGVLDHYLEVVYQVLIRVLIRVGYAHAHMEFDEKKGVSIHIQMKHSDENIYEECMTSLNINKNTMDILFNKEENEIEIKLNLSQEKSRNKKVITKHTLDKSKIERMHYKEEDKTSAKDFLEEFEVDRYMLDELSESETDIKDILFAQEELDDSALQSVSIILDKYVSILHETIEFDDIATSLESLSKLLKRLSVSMIDESKREKLRFYIQGLIDDLGTWKKYIFIEPNTPDIHYLDASLLENCAVIEHYILTEPQEEDIDAEEEEDEGLEFF